MSDEPKDDPYFFIWVTSQRGPVAAIVQKPWLPKIKDGVDMRVLFKEQLGIGDDRTLAELIADYPCPSGAA